MLLDTYLGLWVMVFVVACLSLSDLGPRAAGSGKQMRMMLLGLPGGGKSSSGNTILGSDQFESDTGFNAITTETISQTATVEGRQVTMVDTPGITGERLSPKKLFDEIMKSIREAQPGPHAFVIVVRISRITPADIKMFQMLKKLFGRDALKYSMVLFTHGDQLNGRSMDDVIGKNDHVKDLVSVCGGRYCVFDNKQTTNRQQVRELLGTIDNMVTVNGREPYTDPRFNKLQPKERQQQLFEWFRNWLNELGLCSCFGGGESSE